MMKLYTADLSGYSARVRMQIYAKGIKDITFELPEHWGMPKFRERFPLGRVPVLDIDGDLIPESGVIAEYLEEIHPKPSLLGTTPRENAHVRALARIGDVYLINTAFTLASLSGALAAQTPVPTGIESIVALLGDQLARSIRTLDRMIGRDGFACLGRVTLADCALVPALFFLEYALPGSGLDDPIAANPNVAAYRNAIQKEVSAVRILAELHRGLEERRELINSGAIEKIRAARNAAREAATTPPAPRAPAAG